MGKDLKGKELGKGFHQRKDGRYEARIQINGETIDVINSSLSQLKKDFEAAKKKKLMSSKPSIIVNNSSETIILAEWYEKWFREFKAPQLKSEASCRAMDRKGRNTYVSVLGEKPIPDIYQADIQEATYQLCGKYSTRYVHEGLSMLRTCLEVAVVNRMIDLNPCTCILFPDKNEYHRDEIRFLDNWELKLFLQACGSSFYNEMYQIMLSSGMRIGEVGGLQWENVDFVNQVIRIRKALITNYIDGQKIQRLTTPKTANSYREIPFFGETKDLFVRWKEKQNERKSVLGDRWRSDAIEFGDLVFTTIYGSPVNKYVVQNDLNKIQNDMIILEKLNSDKEQRLPRDVEHIHPHVLRHTACSIFFMKGMDPVVIQRIMGHANYSTTLRYTHLLKSKRDEEVKKIGCFFNGI